LTDFNLPIIEEFRANHGRVGGMFEGAPLLLLTTTGARSGRSHTTPTVYAEDDGRLIVFATNAGQPADPAWLYNLRTNPQVLVELGDDRFEATATELTGAERDRLYADQARRNPAFAQYEANTDRVIPVVALTRIDSAEREPAASPGEREQAADAREPEHPASTRGQAAGVPERGQAASAQLKEIHAGLRKELADLRAAVDDYLEGKAAGVELPRPAAELRRHCLSFCGSLHAHHSREDGVFSTFEQDFPELAPALERLRREHVVVAQLNNQIATLVNDLDAGADADSSEFVDSDHKANSSHDSDSSVISTIGSSNDAARSSNDGFGADNDERLRLELERLTAELEAHFAYEEAHLGPVLAAAQAA
jgi:deazaflavin-dependent oxidoreductase (nitroreductase family)